jgi:hypothetical protein
MRTELSQRFQLCLCPCAVSWPRNTKYFRSGAAEVESCRHTHAPISKFCFVLLTHRTLESSSHRKLLKLGAEVVGLHLGRSNLKYFAFSASLRLAPAARDRNVCHQRAYH